MAESSAARTWGTAIRAIKTNRDIINFFVFIIFKISLQLMFYGHENPIHEKGIRMEKVRRAPNQGTLRAFNGKNQRSRAQCRVYSGVSARAIGVDCAEEKAFASSPGRVQMAVAGAIREICVSLPDGVGAAGVDSEGSADFVAQHGMFAQQSACGRTAGRQQSGEAAAGRGAICTTTSSRLNQMAINCFTIQSLFADALLFAISS
jgi:hypothetical protein